MTIVDTAVRDRADTAVTTWYGRGATPVLPEHTVLRAENRWTATATRALSVVASLRVTIVYAVALVAVSATLTALGPHTRDVVVSRMSTNLHNLARGHLSTLVGSAFVEDGGEVYAWLPGLVCLLALGELIWRSTGLLIAFTVGHIGATLLVAVGLIAAIKAGWVPISVAHASDVGVSYGAVCVLGALTASIPARWRPVWIGWWLGITVTAAWAAEFDFTGVGHVLALLLGMGVSVRLPSMARWSSMHVALLTVGVAVGYFMVSGSSMVATAGGVAGTAVAFLAGGIWRSRSGSPRAMYQPQPCFTTIS
jgi:Rhomboid-like protein